MIQNVFPHTFYSIFQAPNKNELNAAIDKYGEEHIDNSEFDWGKECIIDRIPLHRSDWIDLLMPSLDLLGQDFGKKFKFVMLDPWINYYKRGSYQEVHDHALQDLACVYFANNGKDFSQFIFTDRYSMSLQHPVKQLIGYQNLHGINYNAGDIIFFPGHALHQVTPHNSDVIRKTFACNIMIEEVSG